MVENARFFAQKRTFLHIFAGGRDDFLAGQKWGFFGSGRSRERAGARHFLCHVSRDTKRPTATFLVGIDNKEKVSGDKCVSHASMTKE
jgi:hypothetical protein